MRASAKRSNASAKAGSSTPGSGSAASRTSEATSCSAAVSMPQERAVRAMVPRSGGAALGRHGIGELHLLIDAAIFERHNVEGVILVDPPRFPRALLRELRSG